MKGFWQMLVDLIRVLHCDKKTEIMMLTDAESKFAQQKSKLANWNPTGINLQKAKLTKIQK